MAIPKAIRRSEGDRQATVVDVLRMRAVTQPERRIYTFLAEGEREERHLCYRELDALAQAIGCHLDEAGLRGERALLLYPPGLDFIAAFFGCLYAGVVAVPAYPPGSRRSLLRLLAVARDAKPTAALTTSASLPRFVSLTRRLPGLETLRWLATDDLATGEDAGWSPPSVDSGSLAFTQYTSGSTGDPKGVMVTHANLAHNEEMIRHAFAQREDSVVVGWLPLYHDMGLIGNVLQPLWVGAQASLMSPMAFLSRPRRWLEAITRYRATTSGGPNFAYDLCVRRIQGEEREGLDLSSWRVAFSGAEPVRVETLERFAAAFAPCGFRRSAFFPCYGLAEATLFVSGGAVGAGPRVEGFQADALTSHRVTDSGEAREQRLVSCGRPWLGQQVAIVDPETGERCAPGSVGEIWVAGSSVADGYWGRPEATERDFRARLTGKPDSGPFLRTGDLGFLHEGEIFVTGRWKDLIILRGRNYYPQDIEASAEGAHPALRAGSGAAFSVDLEGEERLVVCWELDPRARVSDLDAVAETIHRRVGEDHEVRVHEVVLVAAGSIPMTSSGKVRRRASREAYLAGAWKTLGRARAGTEEGVALIASPLPLSRAALLALAPGDRPAAVLAFLRERVARAARLPPGRVDPDAALIHQGVDSLAAAELQAEIGGTLEVEVTAPELMADVSPRELGRKLLARLEAEPGAGWPLPGSSGAPSLRGGVGPRPLSHGQRALWFLHRLAPESRAYHIAAAAWVRPALDVGVLRRAVAALVDRHSALRTTISAPEGEPHRRVHAVLEPDFRNVDATGWSEPELSRRLEDEAYRPFDLEAGPLFRVTVFRCSAGEDVLAITVHHILADFQSLAILARELGTLYSRESGRPAAAVEPLLWTYDDYVQWSERRLAGADGERQWSYWRGRLADAPRALELPTDRPRPPIQTYRGGSHLLALEPPLLTGLEALARAGSATLFMALLAVFEALLYRWSGQQELLVSTPTSGRGREELAGLVGYLVNPVVLRADLAGDPSIEDLLARARQTALEAFAHQEYPFPVLVERMEADRDPSRSPLFQASLVLQRARRPGEEALAAFAVGCEGAEIQLGDLTVSSLPIAVRFAPFDLELRAAEVEEKLLLALVYNADLFDATTAGRLLGQLRALTAAAVASPDRPLSALHLLSPAEFHALRWEWSGAGQGVEAPPARLHELFNTQAERTPEAVAVVAGDEQVSFRALRARVGGLAAVLGHRGVGPETRVAVCLERGMELVRAVLGVLEAGAAYVPLDPSYPAERLAFMLADSGAVALVSARGRAPRWAAGAALIAAEGAPSQEQVAAGPGDPQNLAYVIYTSGSTGRPKGVAIEHRSVVALLRWAQRVFPAEELRGVLASTSICFDLSVFEIFAPLAWGGTVLMAESALEAAALPAAARMTLVNTTPSAMAELARGALPPSVLTVNLAGEALTPALAGALYRKAQVRRVLNLYGPTEDTTYSTWIRVEPGAERVTIGWPAAGGQARVADRHLQPVPIGVSGELLLSGEGLARGYLGRPALSAERFMPDPFGSEPGERLYRTGDRARVLATGELDLLGRFDHQVKVRGFRIELGEIESLLAARPGVREAVVVVRDRLQGGPVLMAYAVLEEGMAVTAGELRHAVEARLPAFMVPAHWSIVDSLPRAPGGKVDRRALPAPEAPAGKAYEPPRTPTEEVVAGAFAEVLGVERVGVEDDFFSLGGHSLLATRLVFRLRDALGVELPVREVFAAPTAAGLAAVLEAIRNRGEVRRVPALRQASREGPQPLSFAQERMWFLDQLEPGQPVYNVPAIVVCRGALAVRALGRSLTAVVRRHEVLRTAFVASGEVPAQVVQPPRPVRLPVVDLRAVAVADRRSLVQSLARWEAARPFDLDRGEPLRAYLVRCGAEEHLLAIVLHHIVCDGWSLAILLRELGALYSALSRGETPRLAELPVQYADFALWQRRWLTGEALERLLAPWRERLEGAPEMLDLPTDRRRPSASGHRGAVLPVAVPPEVVRELRAVARRRSVTPFMVHLAAFQALLARYTVEEEVVVGTPAANRFPAETEDLIGLFVNSLVLRTHLGGDPSFARLLERVREVTLEAYARQELPFEKLVEILAPERSLSHTPLFQVMLALQEAPSEGLELAGLALERLDVDWAIAKFDLTLSLEEDDDGLCGGFEYSTELFDQVTVRRLRGHWLSLLRGAVAEPDRRLSQLSLLSPAEAHQLVVEWNDSRRPSAPRVLSRLFEAHADRSPEAVAMVADGTRVSYAALAARANRLAHTLRARGVGPEVRVGVLLERTPELVVALFGVLEAGGAYVPLDPAYPAPRRTFMLEDSGAAVLLSQQRLLADLGDEASLRNIGLATVHLDADEEEIARRSEVPPSPGPEPENLAYVMYTSGSTGRPKGVAIAHRSSASLVAWAGEAFSPRELAGVVASTSVCFDLSVFELLVPLCRGGRVILIDSVLELPHLADVGEATLLNTVPSAVSAMLASTRGDSLPGSITTISLAGEALAPALVERLLGVGCVERVLNLYGPTEDTTYSTAAQAGPARVPIGRPVANSRAWVVDRRLKPVPAGVGGELLLGGEGLARGYLARPGLTAERFVPDPLGGTPGGRLYCTGDRVRALANGELDFLGRLDHQVKLRGFRIEPGEIESLLAAHPTVREAVVVARPSAGGVAPVGKLGALWRDLHLVAYTAPEEGAAAAELRSYLEQRLPAYMVPSAFVRLRSLPRTPGGKVDRRALPAPEAPAGKGYEPPRTPTEEVVAGAIAELLGVERVGVGDDFFTLGGHSLLATRLAFRLQDALGVELPVRDVFTAPTVEELASRVERSPGAGTGPDAPPIQRVDRRDPLPLSFAQQRLWFLHRLEPASPAYNLSTAVRLEGDLEVAALERAVGEVVRRHEALRTRFRVVDGEPVQEIAPAGRWRLPVMDLGSLAKADREGEPERLASTEAERPLDLEQGPPIRTALLRRGAGRWTLLVTIHHIVSDGWSMGVLVRELGVLYRALRQRQPSPLPELSVQYGDFAVWQRRSLDEGVLARQLGYWRDRLAGAPRVLELPSDRPRPTRPSFRGGHRQRRWSAALAGKLEAAARRRGATLFMAALAGFGALLGRWSGRQQVLVGTPIAGRNRPEIEGLIGFFANTLVLPVDLRGDPGWEELLQRVRREALGAYAHQDLPFERLVEELGVERAASRSPLFQVMLVHQNVPRPGLKLPGLDAQALERRSRSSKFDLTVGLAGDGDGLAVTAEYSAELFDATTVERLVRQLERILEVWPAAPGPGLSSLQLLSPAERHELLWEWSTSGARAEAGGELVHELIAAQAGRNPEAVAVAAGDEQVSFRELRVRAGGLAAALLRRGVGPEVRVGVCLERGVALVVAVLSILEAGGAYVPLDPTYPEERLALMVTEAGIGVVVAGPTLPRSLAARLSIVRPDERDGGPTAPERRPDPRNLAYVLYTSGSTGKPKGVMIEHRSLSHLLAALGQTVYQDTGGPLRLALNAPLSFDASVKQWIQLAAGHRLYPIAEEERLAPERLVAFAARSALDGLDCTPSQLAYLLDYGAGLPPRMLVGGEDLPPPLWRRLVAVADTRFYNLYGPTECTVDATLARVEGTGPSFLGRPLPGVSLVLLDHLLPVPTGVTGEIHIAGAGVGRGYLGDPAQTAQRFIPHPWTSGPGERLYRSGDLARFLPDGNLQFLGRMDHQVKVRGFRVELGEIEAVLGDHPAVQEAAVVTWEAKANRPELVAYLTGRQPALPQVGELRAWLRRRLPEHMVPAVFILLDGLPRSANGKLDRKALPPPGRERAWLDEAVVLPRTPVEEVLAGMVAEVLGIERVGIYDNFFDLGGHSLLAAELVAMIGDAFQEELPLLLFFDSPTVESVASFLLEDPERRRKVQALAPVLLELAEAAATEPSPEEG